MILFMVLGFLLVFLVCGLVRTQIFAQNLERLDWEELVGRLEPVETQAITAAAVKHLHPGGKESDLTSEHIWKTIGGAEGLSRMRANSDVLIALATYAQRWDRQDGLIVAEQMRRDGMALKRAVVGIGLGMTCGYGKERVPSYVREATSAYHLMRQRLLVLYGASHSGLYPRLANAV